MFFRGRVIEIVDVGNHYIALAAADGGGEGS